MDQGFKGLKKKKKKKTSDLELEAEPGVAAKFGSPRTPKRESGDPDGSSLSIQNGFKTRTFRHNKHQEQPRETLA